MSPGHPTDAVRGGSRRRLVDAGAALGIAGATDTARTRAECAGARLAEERTLLGLHGPGWACAPLGCPHTGLAAVARRRPVERAAVLCRARTRLWPWPPGARCASSTRRDSCAISTRARQGRSAPWHGTRAAVSSPARAMAAYSCIAWICGVPCRQPRRTRPRPRRARCRCVRLRLHRLSSRGPPARRGPAGGERAAVESRDRQ